MEENRIDWIDPAAARRLLLEYRQTLGVKGGSEIERQINRHTRLGISRKTIENWLNDAESAPSPQTLKIVLRFLQTDHFRDVVPRVRDYLESESRLHRRGSALFDLYGAKELDVLECARINSLIEGWWSDSLFRQDAGHEEASYLYVEPVPDHPFSRAYISLSSEHVLMGSGIVFPKLIDPAGIERFEVRIWSRTDLQENVITIWSGVHSSREGGLLVTYKVFDQPHRTFNQPFFPVDENAVPEAVKTIFGGWASDVIPHDAGDFSSSD
ncbi:MAG: hypothetical protein WDN30_09860 [Pararobbsia sp.]